MHLQVSFPSSSLRESCLLRSLPVGLWRLVVFVRLARWNAQVFPVFPAQRFRQIHDLADMITEVRERTMERLVDAQWLTANRHGNLELFVGEIRQRAEQRVPSLVPLREEIVTSHCPSLNFFFS